MLKATERNKGRAGPGRGKAGASAGPAFTDAPTLSDLHIDKKISSLAQQIANLPIEKVDAVAKRVQSRRFISGLAILGHKNSLAKLAILKGESLKVSTFQVVV